MLRNPKQVVFESEAKMSYEELVMFSELFAKKLDGEKCCAIMCGSEMATAMALLGCFAARVTAVPLSTKYGEIHAKRILEMVGPTAMITDLDGELQLIHLEHSTYVEPRKHPALIMCTSGTTGTPKGVMLSEKNILTNVKDICSYFDIDKEDTILIARPLYHCAVLTGEFLTSLFKGVRICFYSGEFHPGKIYELIEKNQITVFCATPTLFNMLARFKRKKCMLKSICISGECMSSELGKKIAEAFDEAQIYHVYGLTEACPRVSYLPPSMFAKYSDSVGIPLNAVSLMIVNEKGISVGPGQEGILWVQGRNVMLGYYKDAKQTAKVLKRGWLCTGDVAEIDANGLLKIKGRRDDLIIRAGMNIYPKEVEETLKKDSRVYDAFVYGIYKPNMSTQIGLKVSGDFTCVDEVKKMCIETLPTMQVPSFIELVDNIPRNGAGKIIRGDSNARI